METLTELETLVTAIKVDTEKFFDKKNKSAGIRARKSAQELKKVLQNLRKEILEERYKGTNYVWIEDRVDYAMQGDEVGLNTFMMDHPYNREYKGQRVKNWKELYDTTFRS